MNLEELAEEVKSINKRMKKLLDDKKLREKNKEENKNKKQSGGTKKKSADEFSFQSGRGRPRKYENSEEALEAKREYRRQWYHNMKNRQKLYNRIYYEKNKYK